MAKFHGSLVLVATVVVAALVGFGVPLGWVWIGSQLQGDDGVSSLSFSVAVATLAGIIASYVAIMYVAGWVIARSTRGELEGPRRPADSWARRSSEEHGPRGARRGNSAAVEQVFVYTTLIVAAAFWIWFLFFAGSPLPNQ